LKYQAKQNLELSDEDLEEMAGGTFFDDWGSDISYDF
jgi:hypothetical protein